MERTRGEQVLHHRGNYLVRRQRLLPGQASPWHRDRVHRAVNVGQEVFEEVVTFFLDRPDAVPQPEDDSK